MSNLKSADLRKLEALEASDNRSKAKNIAASRKSRARKLFKNEDGVVDEKQYASHIKREFGVSVKVFESIEYNDTVKKKTNTMPTKGSPEWDAYQRRATRISKMNKVLPYVAIFFPMHATLDAFVVEFTECANTEEFLSDAYNHANPGCYKKEYYTRIVEAIAASKK